MTLIWFVWYRPRSFSFLTGKYSVRGLACCDFAQTRLALGKVPSLESTARQPRGRIHHEYIIIPHFHLCAMRLPRQQIPAARWLRHHSGAIERSVFYVSSLPRSAYRALSLTPPTVKTQRPNNGDDLCLRCKQKKLFTCFYFFWYKYSISECIRDVSCVVVTPSTLQHSRHWNNTKSACL